MARNKSLIKHDALSDRLLKLHTEDKIEWELMHTLSGVNATTIMRFARRKQRIRPDIHAKLLSTFPLTIGEAAQNAVAAMEKLQQCMEKILPEDHDEINHPTHYTSGSIECIDYIESQGRLKGFCIGNILKYCTRFEMKNGVADLKKAEWYLHHLIERLEAGYDGN